MTDRAHNCASSVPCAVDDCTSPVKARELCEKHYRRLLRTGDPHTMRRPGPVPNTYRGAVRKTLGEWSARTFQRYWSAVRLLGDLGRESGNEGLGASVLREAIRPNGSINVSKLERLAHRHLLMYLMTEQAQNDASSVTDARRQST